MSETSTETPQPTVRQMRAWLRANRPDLNVGARGFLSAEAKAAYAEANGQA